MQDDTLELLISIGHYARVHRRFDEAHYLFDRLAVLYPQRAFPYLGQGLVELDRANYRGASLLFSRALEVAPDSALARAWLGVCQVFEGHYALGAATLMTVADGDESGASSMAVAFLNLPECAPYTRASRAPCAARVAHAAAPLSTIERLINLGGH
jgi:tetratricopeptide (TPR) repeat protein